MTRKQRTEFHVDEDGFIYIDGRAWEEWSVAELLDLAEELGYVRDGAHQAIEAATTPHERWVATEAYKDDLEREVLAYRALGALRLTLCPGDQARGREDPSARAHVEFALGCELAGIEPEADPFRCRS